MTPNGDLDHLWEKVNKIDNVCSQCQGANLVLRVGTLEEKVETIRTQIEVGKVKERITLAVIVFASSIFGGVVTAIAIARMKL
jgi:uncharacterized protein (DUF697 family)